MTNPTKTETDRVERAKAVIAARRKTTWSDLSEGEKMVLRRAKAVLARETRKRIAARILGSRS